MTSTPGPSAVERPLEAVLFDKDGTLVDFRDTWDPAVGAGLRAAAAGGAALRAAADALGYDLDADRILEGSAFIAEPNDVILALLEPHLDIRVFGEVVMATAATSTVAAAGLPDLLHHLRAAGVALAIATNDWVEIASSQLETLGWADLFDAVIGSDSGYGAKPDPGLVLGALADLGGIDPAAALMVGDTAHDLRAGRAAGVWTALVTNGSEPALDLAALADFVVPSLADLWPVLTAHGLVH